MSSTNISKLIFYILALFSFINIFIIWPYAQAISWPQQTWFAPNKIITDLYFAYKVIFCLVVGILLALVIILDTCIKKNVIYTLVRSKLNLSLLGFIIILISFIWISVVANPYKVLSIWGVPGLWQGAILNTLYILIFISCLILSTKYKELLFRILGLGCILSGIITLIELAYKAPVQWPLVRKLFSLSSLASISELNVVLKGSRTAVSLTLGNPNYVGHYAAMLVPLTLACFIYHINKSPQKKLVQIFWLCAYYFSIVVLLGSANRGGFVGSLCAVLFIVAILIFMKFKHFKFKIPILLLATISTGAYFTVKSLNNNVLERVSMTSSDVHNIFSPELKSKRVKKRIQKISFNRLLLRLSNFYLNIEYADNTIKFYDEYNSKFSLKKIHATKKIYSLVAPNLEYDTTKIKLEFIDYTINSTKPVIKISYYNNKYLSVGFNPKTGVGIFERGAVFSPSNSTNIDFFPSSLFSKRGYIWNYTLPLLKDTIWYGRGAGLYLFDFPQSDYNAKMKARFALNVTIDRPHNLYLQKAHETGLVSMLVFMLFVIVIIANNLVVLFKRLQHSTEISILHVALPAVIGYLITGLVTDATVQTEPIFWILLACAVIDSKAESKIIKE